MAQVTATFQCPDCGKTLGQGSKACPHCGWTSVPPKVQAPPPVQPMYQQPPPNYGYQATQQPMVKQGEPKLNATETLLCMLVGGFVGWGGASAVLSVAGTADPTLNLFIAVFTGLIFGSIIRAIALQAKKNSP